MYRATREREIRTRTSRHLSRRWKAPAAVSYSWNQPRSSAERATEMTDTRRPSILIADDDAGDRLLIEKALEDCRVDSKVSFVKDGQELLQNLTELVRSQSPPALVLLDLNMPRMDGRDVLRIVKHDPTLRSIPIVVLTNSSNPTDVVGAYHEGANTFFQKPMDYAGLVGLMELLAKYWLHAAKLPSMPS